MSNYTITTDFGAKDGLPSGNAAKIIKGSEFTTEFTNIKTAVNSKADTAGDTFTGAVTFDAAVTLNADVTFDTNTMFVDVSANRVGVGTTSPDTSLHVDGGDVKISSDSATSNGDGKPTIFFSESGADEVYAQISYHGDDESGTNNFIGIGCSGAVGTTEALMKENHQMVVKASGKVGIGTSSPESNLHVQNTSLANGVITVERDTKIKGTITAGNSTGLTIDVNNTQGGTEALRFSGNGTERMRIDASGNVGIGTTSPETTLDVKSKYIFNNASNGAIRVQNHGSNAYGSFFNIIGTQLFDISTYYGSGAFLANGAKSSGITLYDGTISFKTNSGLTSNTAFTPTERMRIDA